MASALIKWTLLASKHTGISAQVFLGDVRSAYYRILHSLLDPLQYTDDSLAEVLDESDIPLAYHDPLLKLLQSPGAIQAGTDDPHLVSMLQESCHGPGSSEV